jgi:hypothetical protein
VPSEQVRFILESIASIAGIAALVAIALELQRARRADSRDFMFFTFKLHNELYEEQRIVDALEFSNLEELILLTDDPSIRKAVIAIQDFWELIIVSVKNRAVDSNIVLDSFGVPFYRYYQKFSNTFPEWADIYGTEDFHKDVVSFARKYQKLYSVRINAAEKGEEYVKTVRTQVSK